MAARQDFAAARQLRNLLSANLTSISVFRDLGGWDIDIGLAGISDIAFLKCLASALTSAVDRGLYIATRIYGEKENRWGLPGRVYRVYFAQPDDAANIRKGLRKHFHAGDAFNRALHPR